MVVWSNAKSQKDGLTPVYVSSDGTILKDAKSESVDNAVQRSANGYRLPTNNEWEMAARWLGTTAPNSGSLASKRITTTVHGVTHYWTPDNYASGAVEDVNNASENSRVAWYLLLPTSGTKAVGGKAPNALGMYDVSGNVWERPFDRLDTPSKPLTIRGGDWRVGNNGLSVNWIPPLASMSNSRAHFIGFRLARSNN
jgi:formylglycine-generating enzyme required for sulfatase activity